MNYMPFQLASEVQVRLAEVVEEEVAARTDGIWDLFAKEIGPCRCAEDYTARGKRDPQCMACDVNLPELRKSWEEGGHA